MKLLTIYRKNVYITYKHKLCSFSSFAILIFALFTAIIPFIVVCATNRTIWARDLIFNEKPEVHFQYKYLVFLNFGREFMKCSSFEGFNTVTESVGECDSLSFVENDFDYDGKIDEMKFKVEFEVPPEGNSSVQDISVFLLLDSYFKTQCHLNIPSAVILNKHVPVRDFTSGELKLTGELKGYQHSSINCPFFMRNLHTKFQHNFYPNLNSTILNDYRISNIEKALHSNAAYLGFHATQDMHVEYLHPRSKTVISVTLNIAETGLRYRTTFWQKLSLVWTQYLAVLIVVYVAVGQIKEHLFKSHFLTAWENVPWKKIY